MSHFYRVYRGRVEFSFSPPTRIKDTQRENAPSNKSQALTRSMNMDISVVGSLNELFTKASFTEKIFKKKNKESHWL